MKREWRVGVVVVFAAACFLGVSGILAAQEEKTGQQFEEALVFDSMGEVELHSYSKRSGFMLPYVLCLAAVRESSDLCSHLNDDDAKYCLNNFTALHQFYRQLILGKIKTPELVSIYLTREPGNTIQTAEILIEGFIKRDDSICSKEAKECQAYNKRDASRCPDKYCVDRVLYFQAIEQRSENICKKIKVEGIQALCMADVRGNESACNECASYKKFIKAYREDAGNRATPEMPTKEAVQ